LELEDHLEDRYWLVDLTEINVVERRRLRERSWVSDGRQGEAQIPSATSRPVPLRTAGLEDRHIDDRDHRPLTKG
jgi:hypothetical protein